MRRRTCLGLIGALLLGSAAAGAPRAEFVGHFAWKVADDKFGGISGLELADDGTSFTVLSDRGRVFAGQFVRDEAGSVIGADIASSAALAEPTGNAVHDKGRDSEGLATLPDGGLAVSFELHDRVTLQASAGDPAKVFPVPHLERFEENSTIEALAIDQADTLWGLTEGEVDGAHAVVRLRDGNWLPELSLPAEGTWRPVGADFAPDGRLYVLERDFWPLVGFMSRILRFSPTETGLGPAEVLFDSRAGSFSNLEGLAVWRDASGSTRLTLVGDNNFLPFLLTDVVDMRVVE